MSKFFGAVCFWALCSGYSAQALNISSADYGLIHKIIFDAYKENFENGEELMSEFHQALAESGPDWTRYEKAFGIIFEDDLAEKLTEALNDAAAEDNWFQFKSKFRAATDEIFLMDTLASEPSPIKYSSKADDLKAARLLDLTLNELYALYDNRANSPPKVIEYVTGSVSSDVAFKRLVGRLLDDPGYLAHLPNGLNFYPKAQAAYRDRLRLVRDLTSMVHDRFGITESERLALFPQFHPINDGLVAMIDERWPNLERPEVFLSGHEYTDERRLLLIEKLRTDLEYRDKFLKKFEDAQAAMTSLRPRLGKFSKSEMKSWLGWLINDFSRHTKRAKWAVEEARGDYPIGHPKFKHAMRAIQPDFLGNLGQSYPPTMARKTICELNLELSKPPNLAERAMSIFRGFIRK